MKNFAFGIFSLIECESISPLSIINRWQHMWLLFALIVFEIRNWDGLYGRSCRNILMFIYRSEPRSSGAPYCLVVVCSSPNEVSSGLKASVFFSFTSICFAIIFDVWWFRCVPLRRDYFLSYTLTARIYYCCKAHLGGLFILGIEAFPLGHKIR